MPRLARVVAPHIPFHVIQRGNRRQETFFSDDDYREYLRLLKEWCGKCDVEIWAYCLMPNHVHLILVPRSSDGFMKAIRETHRRYTRHVNFQKGWRGYLWQGRFSSYPMDERYLIAAARYVELNPVKAGLVRSAGEYRWSSAAAHLSDKDDPFLTKKPLLEMVPDWSSLLSPLSKADEDKQIESHMRSGRPIGSNEFISKLEALTGRVLRKGKPGRRPRMSLN